MQTSLAIDCINNEGGSIPPLRLLPVQIPTANEPEGLRGEWMVDHQNSPLCATHWPFFSPRTFGDARSSFIDRVWAESKGLLNTDDTVCALTCDISALACIGMFRRFIQNSQVGDITVRSQDFWESFEAAPIARVSRGGLEGVSCPVIACLTLNWEYLFHVPHVLRFYLRPENTCHTMTGTQNTTAHICHLHAQVPPAPVCLPLHTCTQHMQLVHGE